MSTRVGWRSSTTRRTSAAATTPRLLRSANGTPTTFCRRSTPESTRDAQHQVLLRAQWLASHLRQLRSARTARTGAEDDFSFGLPLSRAVVRRGPLGALGQSRDDGGEPRLDRRLRRLPALVRDRR